MTILALQVEQKKCDKFPVSQLGISSTESESSFPLSPQFTGTNLTLAPPGVAHCSAQAWEGTSGECTLQCLQPRLKFVVGLCIVQTGER